MLKSLKGHFLVASRKLNDLNFYRSVVLIVEHNEQGATGLIVNRPSSFSITNALSRYFDMPKLEDMVFMGGPVEPNGMFALHNAGDLEKSTEAIVPDLFMGSSPEIFEQVIWRISEGDPNLDFRIFFGCAGWAPLQLESEINRMDSIPLRPRKTSLKLTPMISGTPCWIVPWQNDAFCLRKRHTPSGTDERC